MSFCGEITLRTLTLLVQKTLSAQPEVEIFRQTDQQQFLCDSVSLSCILSHIHYNLTRTNLTDPWCVIDDLVVELDETKEQNLWPVRINIKTTFCSSSLAPPPESLPGITPAPHGDHLGPPSSSTAPTCSKVTNADYAILFLSTRSSPNKVFPVDTSTSMSFSWLVDRRYILCLFCPVVTNSHFQMSFSDTYSPPDLKVDLYEFFCRNSYESHSFWYCFELLICASSFSLVSKMPPTGIRLHLRMFSSFSASSNSTKALLNCPNFFIWPNRPVTFWTTMSSFRCFRLAISKKLSPWPWQKQFVLNSTQRSLVNLTLKEAMLWQIHIFRCSFLIVHTLHPI